MLINISTISLENAKKPDFCNVVNHKRDHKSPEYLKATQATNFSRYMHILKILDPKINIWCFQFTEAEIKILISAGYITTLTMRPSKIHAEELEEITDRLQKAMSSEYSHQQELFFRLDACSTKDSTFGIGPIKTAHDVIKRITSSQKAIFSLENRDSNMLIFKPWRIDFKLGQEFRCFFFRGHLTAISQYSPYEYYGWDKRKEDLIELVGAIIQVYKRILPELSKLNGFESCVMDVYYHGVELNTSEPSIEVIEFNPFGWELNSGSACFHWLRDHKILSNENPEEVNVLVVRNTPCASKSQYEREFDFIL